jgi:spore coat polysaccharide biosynthesis protein SpsF
MPRKVLRKILSKPILGHIIGRLCVSRTLQKFVVATTINPNDDELVKWLQSEGIPFYRGSENDVLDRYYHAAKTFGADVIIRVTSDDAFKDPEVVDLVVNEFLAAEGRYDYVSNTNPPTFPEGLDVEAFSFLALQRAHEEATDPYCREHVTPYFYRHPELFRLKNVSYSEDVSWMRWTVDTEDDFIFAEKVYERLYSKDHVFLMRDIVALLQKEPELLDINKYAPRSALYKKHQTTNI